MLYFLILLGSFNVRETLLDLYLFYLEVTRREGYHQVYILLLHFPVVHTILVSYFYCIGAHAVAVAINGRMLACKPLRMHCRANLPSQTCLNWL